MANIRSALLLSHIQLFVTSWTVALQAPQSMRFPREEYWSGLPCPPPGDLPNPGMEPRSPALQADALLSELPGNDRGYIPAKGDRKWSKQPSKHK